MLKEDLLLPVQLFDRPCKPVTDVSVLGEQPQRPALTGSADHDLRAAGLDRARDVEGSVDPVVLAFE